LPRHTTWHRRYIGMTLEQDLVTCRRRTRIAIITSHPHLIICFFRNAYLLPYHAVRQKRRGYKLLFVPAGSILISRLSWTTAAWFILDSAIVRQLHYRLHLRPRTTNTRATPRTTALRIEACCLPRIRRSLLRAGSQYSIALNSTPPHPTTACLPSYAHREQRLVAGSDRGGRVTVYPPVERGTCATL